MKPNRAGRNTAKKAASVQSANTPKTESELLPPVTVVLSNSQGATLMKFELPSKHFAEFERFRQVATMAGRRCETPNAFFSKAISQAVAREYLDFSVPDFEKTMQEASALLALLVSELSERDIERTNSLSPYYDPEVAARICGYMSLGYNLRKALTEQFLKACAFVNPV